MQTAHWTLKLIIIRPSFHSGKDPKNCPVEIKYFAYAPCFLNYSKTNGSGNTILIVNYMREK